MSDPSANHKNFFCSLCRSRFASRPAVRDHIDDTHPDQVVFILKFVEAVKPIETIDGEDFDDEEFDEWVR